MELRRAAQRVFFKPVLTRREAQGAPIHHPGTPPTLHTPGTPLPHCTAGPLHRRQHARTSSQWPAEGALGSRGRKSLGEVSFPLFLTFSVQRGGKIGDSALLYQERRTEGSDRQREG